MKVVRRVDRAAAAILYRRRARRFYGRFIVAGDICFDIGANAGERTAIFESLHAHVVAVEPQHGCAEQLRRRFARSNAVTVVEAAAGAARGTGELRLAGAPELASMSDEWISKVTESGRFSRFSWDSSETVRVTTLDELIAEFGEPAFCKIDVEGYEAEVLAGLSRPLRSISFEFVRETLEVALDCVTHLDSVGSSAFNYSLGETLRLALAEWVSADEIRRRLRSLPATENWGDVYAQSRPLVEFAASR